jgi:protein transport protein SEC24
MHLWDGRLEGAGPPLVPLSGERIDARGWYLLDDSRELLLWAGAGAPPDALGSLFGAPCASEAAAAAAAGRLALRPPPHQPGSPAAAVVALVAQLRSASPVWQPLRCAVQGGAGEGALFAQLVEDRSPGQLSYGEHLLQLHRAVQTAPRT